MKRVLMIVSGAFFVTACGGIDGDLILSSPLTVVDSKGKTKVIQPGHFDAKIKLEGRGGKELEIKIDDAVNGKDVKLELKIPPGTVPSYSGSFEILGANVDQAFNIRGEIDTDEYRTERTRSIESCSTRVRRTECRDVIVTGPDGKKRRQRRCEDVVRSVIGRQDVEYYHRTTTVRANADFIDPASEAALGRFGGSRSDREKIYTHQGLCRP